MPQWDKTRAMHGVCSLIVASNANAADPIKLVAQEIDGETPGRASLEDVDPEPWSPGSRLVRRLEGFCAS